MLVLNHGKQVFIVCLAYERKRLCLELLCYLFKQSLCSLRSKRLFKHIARILHTALGNYLLSKAKLVKLIENTVYHIHRIVVHSRYFKRYLLDLFVGEMLEYFGRILRADRAYDYRRFLCACKCLHIYPSFKLSMLSVAASHHRTYEL
mgnify:CR=1 FL=1